MASGQGSGSATSRAGQAGTSGAAQSQKQPAPSSSSGQSGQGRKKGKGKAPFPLPLEAPAAREVKEKVPGRSQPDGVTLPMRVGGCLSSHWRSWQDIGAETWVVTVLRDGYRVPFKDSPPPLARTPVSFPTYRAGSPRAQALRQEVEVMLAQRSLRNRPRSGSRLLQSSLPGGEGDWRLEACDRSLAFERLRPADAVQDGNSRFGAVICQGGGFSSFLGSEGCVLFRSRSMDHRGSC